MPIPVIASTALSVLGRAAFSYLDKQLGVKLAEKGVKGVGKKVLDKAAIQAGNKAAKEESKAIANLVSGSLKGEAKVAFNRLNSWKVSEERSRVKGAYKEITENLKPGSKLPEKIQKTLSDSLAVGDISKALADLETTASKAVTRELQNFKTGSKTGHPLKVELGNRKKVVEDTIAGLSEGKTLAAAARDAIIPEVKFNTLSGATYSGEQAYNFILKVGEANKMLREAKEILARPEITQKRIMRKFFEEVEGLDAQGKVVKKFVDKNGVEHTPEDLATMTKDIKEKDVRNVNTPQAASDRIKEDLGYHARGDMYAQLQKNFVKSLTTGGMTTGAPRAAADLLTATAQMSPGKFYAFMMSGVIGRAIVWLCSDRTVLNGHAREMMTAAGLDITKYTDEELTW